MLRAGGSVNTDLSYITSSSLFSLSSVSLGSPNNFRYIVLSFGLLGSSRQNPSLLSVSVSGVPASLVTTAGSGFTRASIWLAYVPLGSTGSITYTASFVNSVESYVSVYRLLTSSGSTAYDTQTGTTSTNLSVPEKGVAVGGCVYPGSVSNVWTNLSEDFQRTDFYLSFSSAHAIELTAGSLAISVTNSQNLATASWL